jgi:hypothetical protein
MRFLWFIRGRVPTNRIQDAAPKRVRDRDIKCARQIQECKTKFEETEEEVNGLRKKCAVIGLVNTGAAIFGGFVGGWSAVWTAFKFGFFQ